MRWSQLPPLGQLVSTVSGCPLAHTHSAVTGEVWSSALPSTTASAAVSAAAVSTAAVFDVAGFDAASATSLPSLGGTGFDVASATVLPSAPSASTIGPSAGEQTTRSVGEVSKQINRQPNLEPRRCLENYTRTRFVPELSVQTYCEGSVDIVYTVLYTEQQNSTLVPPHVLTNERPRSGRASS